MKHLLVYCLLPLLLLVAVTRSEENIDALDDITTADVDTDDVTKRGTDDDTKLDTDDLELAVDKNVTSSRPKRQDFGGGGPVMAAALPGGVPGGPSMGGGLPGGFPGGGYPGGGYPGGGYPGGGYPGGGYPGGGSPGGGYPGGGYTGGTWWDPCLTPMSCPRCRDLNQWHPWWCRDICLNQLPKWCFCWI